MTSAALSGMQGLGATSFVRISLGTLQDAGARMGHVNTRRSGVPPFGHHVRHSVPPTLAAMVSTGVVWWSSADVRSWRPLLLFNSSLAVLLVLLQRSSTRVLLVP